MEYVEQLKQVIRELMYFVKYHPDCCTCDYIDSCKGTGDTVECDNIVREAEKLINSGVV